MSIWTPGPAQKKKTNFVIKIEENRWSRVTYPISGPISWHRRYWRGHRDDRIPLWSIWMWATVAIHRLRHTFLPRFCHRIHSKFPTSMPVKQKSARLLEITVYNRKCKTTKSMEPEIRSTLWQRNASKIVKLVNWWYRKICTHFNSIDTSTQSNHNHASLGQRFCYMCADASTWARHHRHFSMPFIHFRSACFWFRIHNALARSYGTRKSEWVFLWFLLTLCCCYCICLCCPQLETT